MIVGGEVGNVCVCDWELCGEWGENGGCVSV